MTTLPDTESVSQSPYFDTLPPEFAKAAANFVAQNRAYYGARLVAIYAFGSAARGETVAGSDLDALVIAHGGFTRADVLWETKRYHSQVGSVEIGLTRATSPARVENALGLVDGIHPELFLASTLFFDSLLLWGDDMCARFSTPRPDVNWARVLIRSPRSWLETFVSNPDDAPEYVPKEASRLQRKLARWALYGTACWLMAQNRFRSFRGNDVLPALGEMNGALPPDEHRAFVEQTSRTYNMLAPTTTQEAHLYARLALRWIEGVAASF